MQPRRGRTRKFQSTLPVRGATVPAYPTAHPSAISIHAPRAGSDGPGVRAAGASGISIHAPRAGSDEQGHPAQFCTGAISIHAPRAGSDSGSAGADDSHSISIHAPRAGSDIMLGRPPPPMMHFNPRSPCGERLLIAVDLRQHLDISIHAPRAGSDREMAAEPLHPKLFQSTLPVRGATSSGPLAAVYREFQSTLPVRGATAKMPKTEPFILSNFHNFKKYTDRTRTKVIIKMELWINLSPFSGANRTGNLWSLLLRTLKGS